MIYDVEEQKRISSLMDIYAMSEQKKAAWFKAKERNLSPEELDDACLDEFNLVTGVEEIVKSIEERIQAIKAEIKED